MQFPFVISKFRDMGTISFFDYQFQLDTRNSHSSCFDLCIFNSIDVMLLNNVNKLFFKYSSLHSHSSCFELCSFNIIIVMLYIVI